MKKTKSAVVSEAATQVATPAVVDWSQYQGATGMENVKQEDLGLPFLAIAQSNSPELKKAESKFIPNCGQGDVFNSLSREVVYVQGEDPLIFVPCAYDCLFVEWKPRATGGGIVKTHRDPAILAETHRNDQGRDELKGGNLIVKTAYFFGMVIPVDGDPVRSIIGLSSTQLKKARSWLNIAMGQKANGKVLPLFSHSYKLSTVGESNAEGDWFGWKVELNAPVNDTALVTSGADIARASLQSVQKLIDRPVDTGDQTY